MLNCFAPLHIDIFAEVENTSVIGCFIVFVTLNFFIVLTNISIIAIAVSLHWSGSFFTLRLI